MIDVFEWMCRYNDVRKQDGSCLGFYKYNGTEIKFDDAEFVWADFNDVEAFTVGNDTDVKFVKELFDYRFCENPFCTIEDDANPKYYGLWYSDSDQHYGEWVRVDDQIKKWTDIKNKFIK